MLLGRETGTWLAGGPQEVTGRVVLLTALLNSFTCTKERLNLQRPGFEPGCLNPRLVQTLCRPPARAEAV